MDLRAHLHPQLCVEIRQRLVHKERVRLADDRTSHGHSLALSAGKRPRLPLEELLDLLVGIVGAFMAILLLPFLKLDIGGDIIGLIVEATLGAVFLLYIVRQIRA